MRWTARTLLYSKLGRMTQSCELAEAMRFDVNDGRAELDDERHFGCKRLVSKSSLSGELLIVMLLKQGCIYDRPHTVMALPFTKST